MLGLVEQRSEWPTFLLRDVVDLWYLAYSRLQTVDEFLFGVDQRALRLDLLLEVVDRLLCLRLAGEELASGLHLVGLYLFLHGKFAVRAGEEDGILETERALLSDEALVCFVGEVAVARLVVLLEPLCALCFLVQGRACLTLLRALLLLVTDNEVLIQLRVDRGRVARDLEASQLAAALSIADIQISENIAGDRLE